MTCKKQKSVKVDFSTVLYIIVACLKHITQRIENDKKHTVSLFGKKQKQDRVLFGVADKKVGLN